MNTLERTNLEEPVRSELNSGFSRSAETDEGKQALKAAIDAACATIAPSWPLDRFIAVNPLWGMTDRPLADAAASVAALSGARLLMPRAWYRAEREAGRLRDEHLGAALATSASALTLERALGLLAQDEPEPPRRSRVVDLADEGRDLAREGSWADFVTNSISQYCAAFFDDGQATLHPGREGGLYTSWRRQALGDKGPNLLMGMRSYTAVARQLPETASGLVELALVELDVANSEWSSYLSSLLQDLNGWASSCMHRRWGARLDGGDDDSIVDFLAVRLAWEWLLWKGGGVASSGRWEHAKASWPEIDASACSARAGDWVFQEAVELAWRQEVIRDLPAGFGGAAAAAANSQGTVAVQAAFCIDVRSEVFRRALEAQSEDIRTIGCAGFFGMPIEYLPLGASAAAGARPQLPGLLAPALRVQDTAVPAAAGARRSVRLGLRKAWKSFKIGAPSTFVFVEALGLTYAWRLLSESLGMSREARLDEVGLDRGTAAARRPRVVAGTDGRELELVERVDLAAGMLRSMSLTRGFARLVLLAGHGSSTRNNPLAAGLDCGACCGQTGEVNARVAAGLLNDPDVRAGLSSQGIEVPDDTRFLAGLHDTTLDEVALFELDELPATHTLDLASLQRWLEGAGTLARRERAGRLGLDGLGERQLQRAVAKRARDWAQVRPEWGLADNAAFIVAPREHTRHLNLKGRAFLHDYRFEEDVDDSVLELIMTAPMVVTHWINFQYYASTVDNRRYGSGDKVLHNVVGGHLGVFEGNGGDLRTGLALQSLHDGQRWMHTPLRLAVFIEAPRDAIERVLAVHEHVRGLVEYRWLDLFQIDAETGSIYGYREQRWSLRPQELLESH